ncbi:MAG: DUF72 domain-containing protein [Gemmatimonadetes bacterium]|nr:DUF72 domain-containing protein [Gemmatimonadota bacterium]
MGPARRPTGTRRRARSTEAHGLHVGTSGWTYDDWDGAFYPEGVTGAERLRHYATRFDTVEVNATFYRLPFRGMIVGWNRRLPSGFHLVVKGPRTVTHLRKLAGCEEPLATFLERVRALKTLRVILWQLPPSLHRDLDRLNRFLSALPRWVRHAVEFRHESWWDEETARLLAAYRTAFVAVSHPRLPDDVVPTADFLYLRFHGLGRELYRYDYSEAELRAWADRVAPHLAERRVYAFFNNDFAARAPKNAERFRGLLRGGPV